MQLFNERLDGGVMRWFYGGTPPTDQHDPGSPGPARDFPPDGVREPETQPRPPVHDPKPDQS